MAVLLASIPLYDNILRYIIADPIGMALTTLHLHGKPLVRSPERVKHLFLSDNAMMTPENLYQELGAESVLVPLQLNPVTWHPKKNPDTPILVMSAENDMIFTVDEQEALAKHYGADYYLMENTAHNAMMEHNYKKTARYLHDWLLKQDIT